MLAVVITLLVFALGTAVGSALLGARGFGLLSFRRTAAPERWRAPAARAFGPLAVYLFTVTLFAIEGNVAGAPAARLGIIPGGTAESSGLRTGDHVVELGGGPITTYYDLADIVTAAGPGASLPVAVLREGRRVNLMLAVDRGGRIGVMSTGAGVKLSLGAALLEAMERPWRSGHRLLMYATSTLRGTLRPAWMAGPVPLHAEDDARTPLMTAIILQAMSSALSWYPVLLLALLIQLVAWARGEGRAPSASADAPGAGGR